MAQEGKFVPYELRDMWGCWPNASAMKLQKVKSEEGEVKEFIQVVKDDLPPNHPFPLIARRISVMRFLLLWFRFFV
jgi:hypothetical protein